MLITFWGNPGGGQTSVMMRLLREIGSTKQVYCILPDLVTPTLPTIFPKRNNYPSMGHILESDEPFRLDELEKASLTSKSLPSVGFLGYGDRENELSYGRFTKSRAKELLQYLQTVSDVVIVDSTAVSENLSTVAMRMADKKILVVSPDIKANTFLSSQTAILEDSGIKGFDITVLNCPVARTPIPLDDAIALHNPDIVLPFSKKLAMLAATGDIDEQMKDKRYNKEIRKLNELLFPASKKPGNRFGKEG